jgi:hypothetical protein
MVILTDEEIQMLVEDMIFTGRDLEIAESHREGFIKGMKYARDLLSDPVRLCKRLREAEIRREGA